jgi:COP9 signalosome complex subunit 7
LSKSASSSVAAVDLIQRATSAPNTFVFYELLATPQIQALRQDSETEKYYKHLELFAYGTCEQYAATLPELFPQLKESQRSKLRQLSLITHAHDAENLTYDNLIKLLQLEDANELEDIVISAIYSGLITGTLDPHHKRVCISSVAPLRDVNPSSVPTLLNTLEEWSQRCTSTLSSLENQIEQIKAQALQRHEEQQEWDAHLENLMKADENTKESQTLGKKAVGGRKHDQSKRGLKGFGGGDKSFTERSEDVDMEDGDNGTQREHISRLQKKRGIGRPGR